jgi:hypothetical protein
MSYTVVMLTFMEDAAVTHRLKDSFPSMEAAKEAGAREIAVRGARAEINRMAEHRKRPPRPRAHRGKARIKARLIGDCDPDEWDLPPKPKWMRWRTDQRYVDKYDRYESVLDEGTLALVARLMGRA